MNNIPRELYSREINAYIDYLVDDGKTNDFDSLDRICKDKLVALGLRALGCDIEIILSGQANQSLIKYLFDNDDKDNEIDLLDQVREASYEKFSDYFTQMITERKDENFFDQLRTHQFVPYTDAQTGETLWRKTA